MPKLLNARQEAKFNSYRVTEQHVDANIAIINGIAAFLTLYQQIKEKIALLTDTVQLEGGALSGIADGKSLLRETLVKKALAVSGIVYSYAADTGNQTLKGEMNIKKSHINRQRDDELAPFCGFIHDRANERRAALADYNITPATLTDLQTAIDAYAADVPKPRAAISNRKTVNANLKTLFRELGELFDRFDRQIETLRESSPDFVNTYFSTREINDPAKRSKIPGDETNILTQIQQ